MVAMKDYESFVKASVEANADIIISGAGLPTTLPKLLREASSKLHRLYLQVGLQKLMCKCGRKGYELPS